MKLRSALLAFTTTALVLTSGTAFADTSSGLDARGDVQSRTFDDQGNLTDAPAVPVPDRTQGDVTAIKVTHTTNTVKVLLRFRELNRSGPAQSHQFLFKTATRKRYVTVDAGPGHWAGKTTTYTGGGAKVRCAVSRTIDFVKNTVLVVVPRSCLGKPRWVRVGGGTITASGNTLYYDDARSPSGSFEDDLVLGPRVYR